MFEIVEHVIDAQHIRGYPNSIRTRQEDVLKLAIKQYIPNSWHGENEDQAITIVATHGLGFPKEVYEPMFDALCRELHQKKVQVRGVWIADMVNQNASGVLNENVLGDEFDWFDGARDLLAMINHFRHEMPRPIVGLGHSFGCAMLTKLSTFHPRLFSTIIFCEPVMFDMANSPQPNPSLAAIMRRDYWPSRAEAETGLTKTMRKQGWADDSIKLFLKYGTRSLPTSLYDPATNAELSQSGITLATTKHQEAWSFSNINWKEGQDIDQLMRRNQNEGDRQIIAARPETTNSLLAELPCLQPSVLYIFGGKSPLSSAQEQAKKLALTGTGLGGSGGVEADKVRKAIVEDGGHLIPLESRSRHQVVQLSASWIEEWYKQFLEDERTIDGLGSGNSDHSGMRASKNYIEGLRKISTAPRTISRPMKESLDMGSKL